ncbi:PREDICTED: mpv17-like protein isoform X2 [Polistes canadensis]|uniref:mpv17-like protein isoform X2 n=1 Tax=Polistes canadensis TaxID=91411 RepID=UPI000718AC5F|nr:PREDICTED: mpv17-like protein isoform X2 [Polistes canadensis]XP_014598370.1 PREDICTED: mpv17-like protein isoform X2 [Polistes canadensis]
MRIILVKFREVSQKYPIVRGMASYAIIWPSASLFQQKITAPTLYCWLRCASHFWPKSDFKSAITKALVEQVTYTPTAMCCFFFGMNLLEQKSISECIEEVKQKFWPTYKIGVCVWPILQTINFVLIPEHNRIVYVSICSLMWTSFLAYMKALETKRKQQEMANSTKTMEFLDTQSMIESIDQNTSPSL